MKQFQIDRQPISHQLGVTILTLVLCSGCTFSPGRPHGEVIVSHIDVLLDIEERLEPGTRDRLRVGNDYVLELEEFEVEVGEMIVAVSAEGTTASTNFDPASPPPGYSLCHNGHCHADDGRLVPYEEIARDLASSSGGSGEERLVQEIDETVMLQPGTLATRLDNLDAEACTSACELTTPGIASAAYVTILALEVRATLFDVSDRQRLPEEGMPVNMRLVPDTPLELFGALPRGGDEASSFTQDIGGTLTILPTIFDGIDWPVIRDQPGSAVEALLDQERYNWTPQLSTKDKK